MIKEYGNQPNSRFHYSLIQTWTKGLNSLCELSWTLSKHQLTENTKEA